MSEARDTTDTVVVLEDRAKKKAYGKGARRNRKRTRQLLGGCGKWEGAKESSNMKCGLNATHVRQQHVEGGSATVVHISIDKPCSSCLHCRGGCQRL
jgi:hypothetical protein